MNYKPFEDRKHLLRTALTYAILWEESRIDAGVCAASGDLAETRAGIKAFQRMLKRYGKSETLADFMDKQDGLQTVSLHEMKEKARKLLPDGGTFTPDLPSRDSEHK